MKVVFDVEYHYYYVLFSPMVMLTLHGGGGVHDGPCGHGVHGQCGHETHHEPYFFYISLYIGLYRSFVVN